MSQLDDAGRLKAARRLHLYFSVFSTLCKVRPLPQGVYLNQDLAANCVERYFLDVDNTKTTHDIAYADAHKRAAFSLKWVVRIRPVQIERGVQVKEKDVLLINELFALFVALEHLKISFENIKADYLRNLLFTLRYRDFNPEVMASEMYLLEQNAKLGS